MSTDSALHVTRLEVPLLIPDSSRIVIRPFIPSQESRIRRVIAHVLSLTTEEVEAEVQRLQNDFGSYNPGILSLFERHFSLVQRYAGPLPVPQSCRLLIGSYFTSEYSFESAALFNPSIVASPDQDGVPEGALRYIMSTRAVGEGHISSIAFRTGTLYPDSSISVHPVSRVVARAELVKGAFDGSSSYEIAFDGETDLEERLIFPSSPLDQKGIEDARFVRFVDDDGVVTYYATYTAYDGQDIRPHLMETRDFRHFKLKALKGSMAENKGMALFPRKIGGKFAMLSRQDNENIYLMFSDDMLVWDTAVKIAGPVQPWELIQIGNCGSPIEHPEGWVVLTHGVGSLRKYSIGAILLDREDPSRVIGRLEQPLIAPEGNARIGYVPNVVYTCGSIVHGGKLIMPYGIADRAIGFATVNLEELIAELKSGTKL